jgi:hypothetical protein
MARMLPARGACARGAAGLLQKFLNQIKVSPRRRTNHEVTPKARRVPVSHDNDDEAVPWMQQLLDNPFLLLFLGVLIPMVVYTLWGVIDILTIPLAK